MPWKSAGAFLPGATNYDQDDAPSVVLSALDGTEWSGRSGPRLMLNFVGVHVPVTKRTAISDVVRVAASRHSTVTSPGGSCPFRSRTFLSYLAAEWVAALAAPLAASVIRSAISCGSCSMATWQVGREM